MFTHIPNASSKQKRAFAYLVLREKFNLREMAELLNEPLSTIQKPDNAYKRLTGALGPALKAEALESLSKVDAGFKQVDATCKHTDHKMVSDLVAMRFAINRMVNLMLEQSFDMSAQIDLASKTAAKVNAKFHVAIDEVTDALDDLVNVAPTTDPDFVKAFDALISAVINLEDLK
jgi:hypothetical protein